MSPPFIFRIDEFTVHPDVTPEFDGYGRWIPRSSPGCFVRGSGGASGQWFFCNGTSIQLLAGWSPPDGKAPYKTFSTIYSGGHGFHVMEGDATNPLRTETWHHLNFEWDPTNYSSALTNAGAEPTLRIQNSGAQWPRMLLPDIYHGPHFTSPGYGGLTGDLPIFLALVAFSMRPERLQSEIPRMMQRGEWGTHTRSHGRTDKRGVIVYVYPYNDNDDELESLEDGELGMYYK